MARRPSRGWGALVALALAALSFWVSGDPTALLGLPLAALLLALPPRRPAQLVLAALGLLLALAGPLDSAIGQFDRVWALLLGIWFVVSLYVVRDISLTSRSLLATLATAASSAIFLLFRPGGIAGLDRELNATLTAAVKQQIELWNAAGAKLPPAFVQGMYRVVEMRSQVALALAALASMAALALAWAVYRRTTRRDEPADAPVAPLPPLREFRFRDELVWVLIAGVLLVLVPGLGQGAVRAGSNLLTFMGALYALRGVAVLVSMSGGAFGLGGLLLVLFAALADSWIPALVISAAVLVGLTDTWLDLRARLAAPSGQGK
ncbi:MAG TPA: DUF2232 domain-containing protein [Longimicrobiales bacterium]